MEKYGKIHGVKGTAHIGGNNHGQSEIFDVGYRGTDHGGLPRSTGAERRGGHGRGKGREQGPAEDAVRPAAGGAAGRLYAGAGCTGGQAALQCRRGAAHVLFCHRCIPERRNGAGIAGRRVCLLFCQAI